MVRDFYNPTAQIHTYRRLYTYFFIFGSMELVFFVYEEYCQIFRVPERICQSFFFRRFFRAWVMFFDSGVISGKNHSSLLTMPKGSYL